MIGSLWLAVLQITFVDAGAEPSLPIPFLNKAAQWPCQPGVPNCCAYLKTMDSDAAWMDPPKDLVLMLDIKGDPAQTPSGDFTPFNPESFSINKVRDDGNGNIHFDPLPLLEGKYVGRWYAIVDEEVPHMACVLDSKRPSNNWFQSKGCHTAAGECAIEFGI